MPRARPSANDAPDAWPQCALCRRCVPPQLITLHHLTPKQKGGQAEQRIALCKPCHKQLHAMFSNKELAREYDSLESLRRSPRLAAFLEWIGRQKPGRNFRTFRSSAHPRAGRKRGRW